MFEFFVAGRYLRAKRKQVVISVITAISVIGVAAGVMALVIALAINSGFSDTLQRDLLALTAHVSVEEKEPGAGIDGWERIAARLAKLPHVRSALPSLYDNAYVRGPLRSAGAVIKGVSVDRAAPVPETLLHLKAGSIDGLRQTGNLPGIILGARLAEYIGAVMNKQVDLLVSDGELTPYGVKPSLKHARVVGLFESGFYDADMNWAFASLHVTQKLFGFEDVINRIELKLDDINAAPEVARAAQSMIGPDLTAAPWEEQNRPILDALKTEKKVTAVTISLIELVAGLNILITLVMMVMEKHRDIAILMSMGARAGQIRNIFVYEGMLIGVIGTSIGLAVGYTLCYLANHYRWLKLDEQVYSLSYVPFDPRWTDGVWIAAAAMAVSVLATLYPALSATRIVPVESLRYE
jgi:lipoprotein-releasing system permease protein